MVEAIMRVAKPTSKVSQIQRQSIPSQIAESLRERILCGELKQGETLVQELIAAEYGVSRMPVREAFKQLESAGLIQARLHKGSVITTPSVEHVMELYELRLLLESELLRASIPRMSKGHLVAAEAILPELEKAYLDHDVNQWGRLNWMFHKSLYVASERVKTLSIIESVNLQVDRYVRLQLILDEKLARAADDHRELLRLCRMKSVDEAVECLREHINHAGDKLRASLEQRTCNS
ncbi:GntR family transcriptional regulator [Pseudomonas putida]|nr:GntR family transcriptional regulator [Pseudomonas putida]